MGRFGRRLGTSIVLLTLLLLLLLGDLVNSDPGIDPYRVLRVSRGANQAEIKQAYKRLVKEWHPDKNKDPGAEDMFIKITKSYEILSNEERRSNYDRYGQSEESQPSGQAQHSFRHFQDSFYFDESFFHFPRPGRGAADGKHTLNHARYNSEVLADSYRRPFLVKVTSEWCFACVHLEPVWRDAVRELEPLGVGIGVVDMGYERRLANQLGAHRAPAILGVVNGRVTFFHFHQHAVVREHLRQFLEGLLPQGLVEKITDQNYPSFLSGWRVENKPSVLLFDQAPGVSLLYQLTAFAFRDYVRFGYVDQGVAETALLRRRFSVNGYAPTMLLFQENTERPADIVQAKGMKRQIMDEFISNNKFLKVPRLVNQKLFDELCPVKQLHRRRKYCVLLLTGEEQALAAGNQAFLAFAEANSKDVLRFAYVHQRQQLPLCHALLNSPIALPPQVVILERRSQTGKVVYRSAIGGWNGSEEDKHRLHEQLELLQRDPAYLTYDATLPELNNELAPMFLVQWMNTAFDYLLQIYDDLLYSNWREMMPILSLIFSALFILFGTIIIQAFSDSGEDNPQKAKAKPPPETENVSENASSTRASTASRPPKKDFVEVTELTDVTYTSNLVRLRPGHINVVLVLTDASKSALLKKFAKEVFSFSGTQTLHFSFLNADKHRRWLPSLLASARHASSQAPDAEDEEEDEGDASSSSPGRSSIHAGHVLALNGHKKYFCHFRPAFTGDSPRGEGGVGGSPGRRSRSGSRSRSRSRSREGRSDSSSRSGSGPSRTTSLEVHHKLDRLGLWMERLVEGSVPRLRVEAWPGLDSASSDS